MTVQINGIGGVQINGVDVDGVQDIGLSWTPTNLNLGELAGIVLDGTGATGILSIRSSLINMSNNSQFNGFPDLTTLDLSALITAGDGCLVSNNAALTSLDLSALTTTGIGFIVVINGALTTLDLSALITTGDGFAVADNTSLTTLTLSSLIPIDGYIYDFSNNALSAASVNAILARFVANESYISGSIDLSEGTNSAPTGQGLTDKATLIARGVTVTTN